MKLRAVRVTDYKCIEDSNEFSIHDVTALVGKNEAGKSALLEAMYKLKPVIEQEQGFAKVDYPRRKWAEYDARKAKGQIQAISTRWELEASDTEAIADALGPKALGSTTVVITRGYEANRSWQITIDEKEVVAHFIKQSKIPREDAAKLKDAVTVAELKARLDQLENPTEKEESLKQALAAISELDPRTHAREILKVRLPLFLYFTQYSKMLGQVSITELQQHEAQGVLTESDRVFLALLGLVGTTTEALAGITKFEALRAELEGVSNMLTAEIFQYWSQNKNLEIAFDLTPGLSEDPAPFNQGEVFRTRIRNNRHAVTVGFDERSAGFVWFFSFLVFFSQMRANYGTNLVILLDEPGLSLHAKAQADLLRYVDEKLRPSFQVVYSTHSPFMIDPERLLDVRTVEDVEKDGKILGTKVGETVLSTDADTLFPIQAALGYEITQTLFIGKDSLLVEGPSDLLYLKWFSEELRSADRAFLDARWVITPCGGIGNIAAFMALFGGNKLHVALFLDLASGQKAKVRSLEESKLLRAGHVFTASMYADQTEADVEDLIGRDNYIHLVSECYGVTSKQSLPATRPEAAPMRVVKEVEEQFRLLPALLNSITTLPHNTSPKTRRSYVLVSRISRRRLTASSSSSRR